MKKWKQIFSRWALVFLWSALIFIGSSIVSPQPTQTFMDFILHKIFHLFEYAVLFILVYKATGSFSLAMIYVTSYAFSDEIHQSFVPTRTAALSDVFIDFIGGLLGWQFTLRTPLKKRKR